MSNFKLSLVQVARVASEFGLEAKEEGGAIVLSLKPFKTVNVEDETVGFDTFIDKNGCVYSGLPGLPLPFKVEGNSIKVYECTEDYGLVNLRGRVNLERSLRFFVMEIVESALHVNSEEIQVEHPLNK